MAVNKSIILMARFPEKIKFHLPSNSLVAARVILNAATKTNNGFMIKFARAQ
jgi:hypothetical protein